MIFYGELCKLASSEIQKLLATYYLWVPSCFSIAHWELVKLKLPTMLTCSLLVISTEPVKFHEFVSRDECKGCGSEGRLFSAHSSSCHSSLLFLLLYQPTHVEVYLRTTTPWTANPTSSKKLPALKYFQSSDNGRK
ncbi:uncharacterized protein LOC116930084 [Daphnia magna]|uniref:uncharacterized protein LOC116930084 n=1 Tax=Daphnia magna TaxID=35525 RepID=UPI001E1BD0E3|nr:uncharacterized protein LOC116930084 [Daphnia magna]